MEAKIRNAKAIALKNARLDDPFWGRYTRLVTEKLLPYQWRALNDLIPGAEKSGCVENLRIAAGEREGRFHGYVFQDSDLAKWLEAAAYSLTWRPDPALERLCDEAIELIGRAQEPDGYIDSYFTIEAPRAKFRNLRQGHELYVMGHMMEGAAAYFDATGKRRFLDIMCRTADLICDKFNTPEFSAAYPGHEEIELGLFKLGKAAGEKRYIDMARAFVERRGVDPDWFAREEEHPDYVTIWGRGGLDRLYHQCHLPVREQKTAEGHAVRAAYLYSAMADIAFEYGDESLLRACETLYGNIVDRRMYITGGIGSSGAGERFTADFDLPNASGYAESCASVGLAMFCRRMLTGTGDGRYADTMERALYNTVAAGVSLGGEEFFYVNPLEVWPESCVEGTSMEHVKPVRQRWFGCACCPPNIARTLAGLAGYAATEDEEDFRLDLFISGRYKTPLGEVEVRTRFPFEGSVTLKIEGGGGRLALRLPGYVREYAVLRNGERTGAELRDGYLYLSGPWDNDTVEYRLEIPPVFVWADTRLRACAGRVAVMKGPVVYCLEEADNGTNLSALTVDTEAGLAEEYRPELLGGTAVIRARGWRDVDDPSGGLYRFDEPQREPAELTFVPYCLWDNRGPGEMAVWVRRG